MANDQEANLTVNPKDIAESMPLNMGEILFLHNVLPKIQEGLKVKDARTIMDKLDATILAYEKKKTGEADEVSKT